MSRSLKEGEVEELKSHADIYSVVSGYVKLKKSGKSYSGLCPFHKEKTPSFSVDQTKQLYHCFGCGEGGDLISFVEKIENMDFIESVEFLANKVGYKLKYNLSGGSREFGKVRNKLYEINELAKKYFQFILFKSKAGRIPLDYLKKRGFTEETIQEFEVGYSMDLWDNFTNFIIKRKFKPKEVIDSGLAIESTRKKGAVYDRFRGRIMFPIEDIIGKPIGFGGRIISEKSNTARQSAKYINTPETRIYSKSKNIYHIHQAKNFIVDMDEVLIVEGYTDVMALYQSGFKNAVASLGTALTSDQIKILGRFTKNIVLVFDSDQAGMNASLKGMERLREYNERLDLYFESNLNIKVAILEKDYDPAEFILKKGKQLFMEKIKNAQNIIDFTIDVILDRHDINDLSGKLKASDSLINFISTLSSSIIQEECIKKVARKLNLKENLLLEEMQKKEMTQNISPKNYWNNIGEDNDREKREKVTPLKKVEIEALKLIINGQGEKFDELLEFSSQYFRFEDTRELFGILKEEIRQSGEGNKKVNFPIKISSGVLENAEVRKLYNFILFSELHYSEDEIDKASVEILNNLKKIHLSEEIEFVRKKMMEYEDAKRGSNDEEISKLDRKHDSLYQRLIKLEQEKQKLGIINI
ncbi:MAG: DNA primase [Candidatus Humimicrobiaceae bacterium]